MGWHGQQIPLLMSRLCTLALSRVATSTRTQVHTASPLYLVLRRNMAAAAPSAASSSVPRVPGPIVSVQWLQQHYPQVRVLDASWYMPNEKQDPVANFKQARLPGARFFDLEKCTSKEGDHKDLPHMLPSAEQLSKYLAELGVKRDDCVVLYDGKGIFSAPRVRFTLQHFGVDNVAILEGGIKAWKAAGLELESGEEKPAPATSAPPSLSPAPSVVRSLSDVEYNIPAQSFTLVDARAKGRFDGTDPEPRPDIPSGHIEGAKNVPFMSLLETDSKSGATVMRQAADLEKAFAAAGVDPRSPAPLVGSCGSGVTACVVLLGLEMVGRKENVGLYDGSWTEWALRGKKISTNKQ